MNKMDPDGSGVESNTNSTPPRQGLAKRHLFVWNNYPENYLDLMDPVFGKLKWVAGQEVAPTTGTPHLQGYIEHNGKCRPIERYKLPKQIKWMPVDGTREDNVKYCMKTRDQDPVPNEIVVGTLKPMVIKIIENMYPWQEEVVGLVKEPADDRSINWYWEKKGGTGKSALVKYLVVKYGAIMVSGKAADMKYAIQQYVLKHARGPNIILIDIPRTSMGYLSYTGIEEIKNGCFFSGKYEGGMVVFNAPHIICFANEKPDKSTMSKDRWNIVKIS